MFRFNLVSQAHCLFKSQAYTHNVIRHLSGKSPYKVAPPYMQSVCSISTGNCTKKDALENADKSSVTEVYVGSISKIIRKVKVFSLFTSAIGVTMQPLILRDAIAGDKNTALIIGACTFIGFFTYVTPILLHILTKRYILRLEHCSKTDEYHATTYTFLLRNKVEKFKAEEVYIPDIPGMLTSFKVKDRSYFIDKDSFLDIVHYKKIMGFDKPIDFKLSKPSIVKKDAV